MSADYPLYQHRKREAAVDIFLAAENKGKEASHEGSLDSALFSTVTWNALSAPQGSPCIYLTQGGHGRGGRKPSGKQ